MHRAHNFRFDQNEASEASFTLPEFYIFTESLTLMNLKFIFLQSYYEGKSLKRYLYHLATFVTRKSPAALSLCLRRAAPLPTKGFEN